MKYSLRLIKTPRLFIDRVFLELDSSSESFVVAYREGGKIFHREEKAYHILWEPLGGTKLREEYEKNKDYYFEEAKKLFIKDML